MDHTPYRIAMMMELETGFSRHFDVYTGAHRYAEEHGWHVVIDEFAEYTLAEIGDDDRPYDGVIARANEELAEHAQSAGMPLVNVWLNSPVVGRVTSVYPDYAAAGRLRAEHLLSRGVTRFVMVYGDVEAHRLERDGFIRALDAAGYGCEAIAVTNDVANTIEAWRGIERVMDHLIKECEPPIGVFCGSEMVGRLLAQRCETHGLAVPEDVAIIAGHNEAAFVERPSPSLTSVDVGHERVGYEAARLLHRMIDGQAPPTRPVRLPPVGVVARESTDFQVVQDSVVEEALKYIADHYQRRIGPNDVAGAVGVQTRTLQNRFNKALGWPVATEIRRVRIERAKRALTDSDRLVTDIAEEVGYPNPMRLYEVFRRELGVSPSEYRKQRQSVAAPD